MQMFATINERCEIVPRMARTDRSDRRNETAEPSLRLSGLAQQIAFVFGIEIDKDIVRRVLAKHCRPTSDSDGPSWLTFLGHAKDSLRSVDLIRCESLILKTHWVMLVMDQFTRRIIGFAVQPGVVDGPVPCRMFNQLIAGAPASWPPPVRVVGVTGFEPATYTSRRVSERKLMFLGRCEKV
jgi:hypothetical protein